MTSVRNQAILIVVVSVVMWSTTLVIASVKKRPFAHSVIVVAVIGPPGKVVIIGTDVLVVTVVMMPMMTTMPLFQGPAAVTKNPVEQGRRLGRSQDRHDVSRPGVNSHVTAVEETGPGLAPTEHCLETEDKTVSEMVQSNWIGTPKNLCCWCNLLPKTSPVRICWTKSLETFTLRTLSHIENV